MKTYNKTNSVNITKYKLNEVQRKISTRGIWFKDHAFYNLEFIDDCLIIKKVYGEHCKKTLNMSSSTQIYFDIPYGIYECCEEESDEDELVIYINS